MADEQEILNRWRLVLGRYASGQISFSQNEARFVEMEEALDYLYEREYGEEQGIRQERGGGSEGSKLMIVFLISRLRIVRMGLLILRLSLPKKDCRTSCSSFFISSSATLRTISRASTSSLAAGRISAARFSIVRN